MIEMKITDSKSVVFPDKKNLDEKLAELLKEKRALETRVTALEEKIKVMEG